MSWSKAMLATGKPVIVLLFNGRPLSINYVSRERRRRFSSAGISARRPDAPWRMFCSAISIPGGKLPITIPRSAGHLPAFYNYKPSARRGYLFDDVSPLYPFGFGLSYTTFTIGNVAPGEEEDPRGRLHARAGGRDQHRHSARARKWCRCTFATWSAP